MESPTWPESLPVNRKKAIQELTQGQEWTDKLREILQRSENIESDPTSLDGIVEQILGMFDNTLSIVGSCSSNEPFQLSASYLQSTCSLDEQKSRKFDEPFPLETSYLQSLCSLDEQKSRKSDEPFLLQTGYLQSLSSLDEHKSRKSDEPFRHEMSYLKSSHGPDEHKSRKPDEMKMKRGCYRRKNSWTSTQVTSVLTDDGHAWRKYGQKKIHESKHERKNSWTSTQVTSVLTDDGHAWRKYGQKKIHESKHERKNSWTSTQVTSVLTDDGHAWRKYGQKKIHESKHERSYYRCTYKLDQGCLATKQVQMIKDNPPIYKITYMRNHTCKNLQRAPQIILDSWDPEDTSFFLNFEEKGLTGNKQVIPHFHTMKHEPKDGSLSLGNWRDNRSTPSDNYLSWDPNTQVPLESISMSVGLDHGDMVSSGYIWGQSIGT